MAISTNQKPTIYRNSYENTAPGILSNQSNTTHYVSVGAAITVKPKRRPNDGLLLAHCRRPWTNIELTLALRRLFGGKAFKYPTTDRLSMD